MPRDDLRRLSARFLDAFNDRRLDVVERLLDREVSYRDLGGRWRADGRGEIMGLLRRVADAPVDVRGAVGRWVVDDEIDTTVADVEWRLRRRQGVHRVHSFVELTIPKAK